MQEMSNLNLAHLPFYHAHFGLPPPTWFLVISPGVHLQTKPGQMSQLKQAKLYTCLAL